MLRGVKSFILVSTEADF